MSSNHNFHLRNDVLGTFCSLFMSAPMTPAVSNFFLPAVASTTSFPSFPTNDLLRAMTRVKLSFNEDFLHSLLMMYEKRLDSRKFQMVGDIVATLTECL